MKKSVHTELGDMSECWHKYTEHAGGEEWEGSKFAMPNLLSVITDACLTLYL